MPRFFLPPEALSGPTALLEGADAEHLRVLRLRPGDTVTLCDGAGTDVSARLRTLAKGAAELEILSRCPSPGEAKLSVRILAGLPKGERSDLIVQKCTECGAAEILFFLSRFCVARPEKGSLPRKIQRWQRIALEAAKQSGRGRVPRVDVLPDLSAALAAAKETALPLFLYETGERTPLRTALAAAPPNAASAAILTGPEGGFAPEEADFLQQGGLAPCSMGPRILRCETAPPAALTAVLYHFGEL
jgi:16S rRNA (uracil1498-N3)-methyltransferase